MTVVRPPADPALSPIANSAPDYIERNRAAWDRWAPEHAAAGRKAWTSGELSWGLWSIPETELRLTEGVRPDADVIELGCGTAAISAWLARQGMRPVAVDFSHAQLDTAERLQREVGPLFPLVHANAEEVPFDTDSFDFAVSEYGAALWCDPRRWLREAYRLLRPNGRLVFIVNSALLISCTPPDGSRPGDRLVRDYFTSAPIEFAAEEAVEFHLTHGQWVNTLRAAGFMVEDLVEVRPRHGAKPRFPFVSVEWARRWPSEEIWVARKIG